MCISPGVWEAPNALVTTRAPRGSSSAQAGGTLSHWKAVDHPMQAWRHRDICAAHQGRGNTASTGLSGTQQQLRGMCQSGLLAL